MGKGQETQNPESKPHTRALRNWGTKVRPGLINVILHHTAPSVLSGYGPESESVKDIQLLKSEVRL